MIVEWLSLLFAENSEHIGCSDDGNGSSSRCGYKGSFAVVFLLTSTWAILQEDDDADEFVAAEKTSFNVTLKEFDSGKKVALIKEIKNQVEGMNLVAVSWITSCLFSNIYKIIFLLGQEICRICATTCSIRHNERWSRTIENSAWRCWRCCRYQVNECSCFANVTFRFNKIR